MKSGHNGFSLVEMLIALVLGLVLLTGIGHLFMATNKTYALQDELSRIQENARLAMEILTRDIRMASYTGCPSQTDLANVLYSENNLRQWMIHFDKGISGISSGSEVRGSIDSNAISEAVIVYSLDREKSTQIVSHNTGTARLTTSSSHGYDQGDLLAVLTKDCRQVSIFRAGLNTENSIVTHPAANSGSLYNCSSQLQGDFNCHTSSLIAKTIEHNESQLVPVKSTAFYLRESNGVPTLYRKRAGEYTSGSSIAAEALVEGVENINILYGVDTDQDGVVNQYQTASNLGLFSEAWLQVVSVKLELLIRSFTQVSPEPQAYFFAGDRIIPSDNFLRSNFVATIDLRNRAQY